MYPLVGWFQPTPLKNDGVSWDDDIPNWMESHKMAVPNHQPDIFWSNSLLWKSTRLKFPKSRTFFSTGHGFHSYFTRGYLGFMDLYPSKILFVAIYRYWSVVLICWYPLLASLIHMSVGKTIWFVGQSENPPAPKVLGRDLPDGTRKRLQVYLGGGGAFFGQNLLFLIGRDARLQKTL